MPIITKEKKQKIVDEICQNISNQEAIFFVNYKGLKGDEINDFRNKLQQSDSKLVVARKTLVRIAFQKEGIEFDPVELDGEVGFVFGFEDGVSTAKVIRNFDKEELVTFLGGFYEGNILTAQEARHIAEIPSRDELLSKLVGSLNSPATGFVQVLEGNIRGLLNVLSKAKV